MERETLMKRSKMICIAIISINNRKMVNFGTKGKEYVHKKGNHK